MNETQTQETRREETGSATCCPFCYLVTGMRETKKRHSGFFTHMLNAQMEVLQAFRSVLDQQINSLENRKSSMGEQKKATKIEVE